MEFEVMSREKARKMSFKPDIKDCIIISITDTHADINHFAHNPHIRAVLNLKFDDVDFGENDCITPEDGVRIIDFVNKHLRYKRNHEKCSRLIFLKFLGYISDAAADTHGNTEIDHYKEVADTLISVVHRQN